MASLLNGATRVEAENSRRQSPNSKLLHCFLCSLTLFRSLTFSSDLFTSSFNANNKYPINGSSNGVIAALQVIFNSKSKSDHFTTSIGK